MSAAKKKAAASIVWFEIPADDLGRAKTFYSKLFGWKIAPFPGMPGGMEYLHIDTGGPDASADGGLMARKHPEQPITNYISVPSVTRSPFHLIGVAEGNTGEGGTGKRSVQNKWR